jgi:acetyltransferase-like isoleucine patch superfamily enzyme
LNENIFFDFNLLKQCGENVIIGKTVRIRNPEKVSIGSNVIIDDFTYISGEAEIGDYVHIAAGCVLSAGVSKITMEPLSGLSAGCKVYGGSSNYTICGLDMPTIPIEHRYNVINEDVLIQSFSLIGASSIILPGCKIPQGCAVAAALTVRKKINLKPWQLLIDETGRQIPRRGVTELKKRVSKFYEIEINNE